MKLRETGSSPSKTRAKIVEEETKEGAKQTVASPTGDFIKDFYLEMPSIPEGEELGNCSNID
jgi:hypothetical protein